MQLQEANSGLEKARIDAESREEVARINAQGKADAEEIKGYIQLLVQQMQPPPVLAAKAAETEGSRPDDSQASEPGATGPTGEMPGS